jgi:predicted TIM-barrel fold metal-dependent hydrolase
MSCSGNVFPGVYPPTIEFPTDTTRTITNLLSSGTFARRPDVRFIFSHGGGTLPMIVQRIVGATRGLKPEERAAAMPRGVEYELQRQYYDLASVAPNPGGMAAVFKLFPVSQLFYGSDAPFGSTTQIADALAKFELSPADIKAIQRENALRLFPRFS